MSTKLTFSSCQCFDGYKRWPWGETGTIFSLPEQNFNLDPRTYLALNPGLNTKYLDREAVETMCNQSAKNL